MSSIFLLLQKVHEKVHDLPMKLQYNEPKIYTGGIDIKKWSRFSKKEQNLALSKQWYLYYSFRDPKTNKLVRQPNIKAGANKFKDKRSRYHILKTLKQSLEIVLAKGFNPYADNQTLFEFLSEGIDDNFKTKAEDVTVEISEIADKKEVLCSLSEAFKVGLDTKYKILNSNSYSKFKSRINRFRTWLKEEGCEFDLDVSQINKKIVIKYLNTVLQNTSPRNRNNARTDLASLFQVLEDNEIIKENFVKKINVLKSIPKRNKTYTPKQQKEIYRFMELNDPILNLFVKFVSYNFLRPIEVCRLTIGDLDITDRKLYVKAKNQPVKTKIIPNLLIKELPDLSGLDKNESLFTPNKIGGEWNISEENKRDFFTKKFKKVKDHFGLGVEYGLYSFRHTFITKLYKEMAKESTPFEVKSKLQLITGHSTMKALELYLRDIDAELPEDYSKLLK